MGEYLDSGNLIGDQIKCFSKYLGQIFSNSSLMFFVFWTDSRVTTKVFCGASWHPRADLEIRVTCVHRTVKWFILNMIDRNIETDR